MHVFFYLFIYLFMLVHSSQLLFFKSLTNFNYQKCSLFLSDIQELTSFSVDSIHQAQPFNHATKGILKDQIIFLFINLWEI